MARQLKERRIADVGQTLERLIAETADVPEKDKSLIASLNLSLERLETEAQQLLPRLGLFHKGVFEDDLLAITEYSEAQWQALRPALETTGLIQPEYLPDFNVPYLKFHPTLAPALWSRLSSEEQAELLARHRQRYYRLSAHLYQEDTQNPYYARAIALRELPDLLFAVRGALDAGEEWAVDFVAKVNWFLDIFGLNKDRAALTQRAEQLGQPGSEAWYLTRTNFGEQLFNAGRYAEAEQVFAEILAELGEETSFNRCNTLEKLGRCLSEQGRSAQAAELYRQAIAVAKKLPDSDLRKRAISIAQTDLGTVLTDMGNYDEAHIAYQQSLALKKEIGDPRMIAILKMQLGYLALNQGNLAEAAESYQEALKKFQGLNEPAIEAVAWHQLGIAYEEARQWEAAEGAYRESARIEEYKEAAIVSAILRGIEEAGN